MPNAAEHQPTVTVVVPVYNDLERLRLCLRLIVEQSYENIVKVIVVDNRSSIDLHPALPLRDPRFVLIREDRKGSYAARNAALPLIDSDVVAFTDADCRPQREWIAAAVTRLAGADAPDAVGGAIRLVFRQGKAPVSGPELYESVHEFDQRQFVESMGFAATANLVATRAAVERVGPFNADLLSGGDDDWGHRLHDAGGTMVFETSAIVDHPSRSSWPELTVKSVRVAAGMAGLSQGERAADDIRYLFQEARLALAAWVKGWSRPWPATVRAKARYAAALSWVSAIRIFVRVGYRLGWRPST